MNLDSAEIKQFRAIAHNLKPVILIGDNGVTEALLSELDRALNDHELIKVKINAGEREDRASIIGQLAEHTGSTIIQKIGKVVVLYRKSSQPDPRLSNVLRNKL